MIYDCLMFNDEVDLLDIRIRHHRPFVDHTIVIESAYTYSGKPKEYNAMRCEAFRSALAFGRATLLRFRQQPDARHPAGWAFEHLQRNLLRGYSFGAEKVSCFCCTYGRPLHVLAEAVESFLRQDYPGEAELVILNDLPGQRLTLGNHVQVPANRSIVIVNMPERIPTLGQKFRQAVDLCTGSLLLPWEDDDIYLPWRITWSVDHLKDGYYHTNRAWYEHGGPGVLVPATNLFHCNMAFTRELYDRIGGYDADDTPALDQSLYRRLTAAGAVGMETPWDKVHYIYRWQHSGSWHGSGLGDAVPVDETARRVAEDVKAKRVGLGEQVLVPKWSRDWVALAAAAAKAVKP